MRGKFVFHYDVARKVLKIVDVPNYQSVTNEGNKRRSTYYSGG